MIYLECTQQDFIPGDYSGVLWLEPGRSYPLAQSYWSAFGQDLAESTWRQAHDYGYQYAAVLQHEKIIAMAGVWRFSDAAWDVAAVSTLESERRKGYGRRLVGFVSAYILQNGRLATCSANDDNAPMLAVARKVGFYEVSPEKVRWTYPTLPDF